MMTISRERMPALGIAMALAACSPSTGRNESTPASPQNVSTANEAGSSPAEADNATAAPKSILRPEVIEPQPAAPVLAPLDEIVPFGASGLVLDDAGRAMLDKIVLTPTFKAGGAITLRGHSDSRGYDGDNVVASRKRAEAVRDYLEKQGVAEDRISIVALGETRPIAPNAHENGADNPEGRAKNRRVEVSVALPAETSGETAPPEQRDGVAANAPAPAKPSS